MKVSIPKMTIQELDRIPEDGNRYELIGGELYVTAAPRIKHQRIVICLGAALNHFVEKHKLGLVLTSPVDVYLEPPAQTRVQPDLIFVAHHRRSIIQEKAIYGAPNLVIEVVSESSYRADARDKCDLYRRAGVEEYWFVDPDEHFVVLYRFGESGEPRKLVVSDTLTTPLLPGLEIPLSPLFAESL